MFSLELNTEYYTVLTLFLLHVFLLFLYCRLLKHMKKLNSYTIIKIWVWTDRIEQQNVLFIDMPCNLVLNVTKFLHKNYFYLIDRPWKFSKGYMKHEYYLFRPKYTTFLSIPEVIHVWRMLIGCITLFTTDIPLMFLAIKLPWKTLATNKKKWHCGTEIGHTILLVFFSSHIILLSICSQNKVSFQWFSFQWFSLFPMDPFLM